LLKNRKKKKLELHRNKKKKELGLLRKKEMMLKEKNELKNMQD